VSCEAKIRKGDAVPSTKQFDVDEALDRAVETFWEHGYKATSMCTLLDGMGIQKGSFYSTFSSKHEIFLNAMRRYVERGFGEFKAAMRGLPPREAIEAMFENIAANCTGKGRDRGCLVINTALELAPSDDDVGQLVRRVLARHEKLLADLVRDGQASGEIGATDDPRQIAKALLGLIIGMRVYARAGLGPSYVTALRGQTTLLLDRAS
jgi:TetR/AcrR family transcriptional repressor of nem operon